MNDVKVAYVQWPDRLMHEGAAWDRIRREVGACGADLLVTNEMPFGSWLPEMPEFDGSAAQEWVELHETALEALKTLQVSAIISSRPVMHAGKLANEAFALDGGQYRYIHHKKFFPQEVGFYEESWFDRGDYGFETITVANLNVGVLLCTELFFNERARAYGKSGVDLIVCPRSSGKSMHRWQAAGALAAIVSGAYLVSSNRHGRGVLGQEFGGVGFAFSPDGLPIGETSAQETTHVASIDRSIAREQKHEYPCYVREL
jgi:N-carbamoylputrescine amidase